MGNAGTPHGRFLRAIERQNVLLAEVAARELGRLSLEDALSLLLLYAEREPEKFEPAAVRWLGRLALERRVHLRDLQAALGAAGALPGHRDAVAALLTALARAPRR